MPGAESSTLVIHAKTLPELFDRAVRAVADQLSRAELILPRESRSLEVGAGDVARLLESWLAELLHIHATEGTLFGRAEARVRRGAAGRYGLQGHLWGEPRDPDRHPLKHRIESVETPEVWKDDGLWHARLVFDLLPL